MDTILSSTLTAGIPPAPLILAPDFLWFWGQATNGFNGLQWLFAICPTMEWLHWLLCKLGNVIDRPLEPFSEGFGPFTIISCHKIQEVNSKLTSNLKKCNFQKGSGDYNAVPNILYRPYEQIQEADSKESG